MVKAFRLSALLLVFTVMQATSAPLDFSIAGSVSGSNQQLVLNASVEPAAADNGKTGNLYIWALNNGSWYFLTAAGWRPWNNEEIPPVYRMGALSRQTLPVLDGSLDVSSLVGTEVYVGYGLNLQDMLSGSKYTKIHTISPDDVPPPTVPPQSNRSLPVTGPSISGTTVTTTTFSAAIDVDGTGYYLAQPATQPAPTVAAVIAANHSFAMTANTLASVKISGLKASTAYRIYFVAKNTWGDTQAAVSSVAVTTMDPPVTTEGPSWSAIADTSINFSATIDKDGTGYYLIQAENEAAPTVEAVIAANHSFAMTANSPAKATIGGLKASTAYRIYFVAKNSWGEAQAAVKSLAVTTAAAEGGAVGYVLYGGLTWSPNTLRVNWVKAKAYCAAFNGLGLTGWRQPNQDETVNLIISGAINGHGWVLNDYTWTSQQDYMGRPVAVDWFGGYVWVEGGNKEDSANEARVTCVR